MGKNVSLKGITVLAIISCISICLLTLFKSALELEDAEQSYYSQWFRWGYDDQPPLYTWLQYSFNEVFGVNKISFSLLRGLLFGSTLLMLHRFAAMRIKNSDTSKLTVLVLVLVPVFIDFTFRRLSHTSLLCLLIVGTYYCVQLLLQSKSILNYALLGFVIGAGLLSKYNYLFFLLPLILVSIWDKNLRYAIWNFKILISVSISILCILPHAYWLLGPDGYQFFLKDSVTVKLGGERVASHFSVLPTLMYLKGFMALVYLIFAVLLVGYFFKMVQWIKPYSNWMYKMFIVQVITLGLFFTLFQVQHVETRWLLPLFIPFAVILLESIEIKHSKKVVTLGFYMFYAVIFAQFIRTPIEKFLGISSSIQYSFQPIAEKLNAEFNGYQWILPNVTYAGNVRLLHPESTIFATDDYSLSVENAKGQKVVTVSLEKLNMPNMIEVDSIIGFGKEKENLYFYVGLRD